MNDMLKPVNTRGRNFHNGPWQIPYEDRHNRDIYKLQSLYMAANSRIWIYTRHPIPVPTLQNDSRHTCNMRFLWEYAVCKHQNYLLPVGPLRAYMLIRFSRCIRVRLGIVQDEGNHWLLLKTYNTR